jgi:hypothetical protein
MVMLMNLIGTQLKMFIDDVVEELTPENDKRLGEYIVNTLNGQANICRH